MLYTICEGISNEMTLLFKLRFFLFLNQVLLETYIHLRVFVSYFVCKDE